MIKEEFRKIEATQIIHHFYCDKCGEEVGASIEYEDGYVPIPPFAHDDCNTIKVRMGNYYMIYETNYDILCNACYEEVINEIDSFFEKLSPRQTNNLLTMLSLCVKIEWEHCYKEG